jgi:hypothetical protein
MLTGVFLLGAEALTTALLVRFNCLRWLRDGEGLRKKDELRLSASIHSVVLFLLLSCGLTQPSCALSS